MRFQGFVAALTSIVSIPQDDEEDWSRDSVKIASIYSNSSIMLSSTNSTDGTEGLFNYRSPPTHEKLEYTKDEKTGNVHVFPVSRYASVILGSSELLSQKPLSQRGWALQERWLSPRVVHFGSKQMFFECHGHFLSEDGFRSQDRTDSAYAESSPARTKERHVDAVVMEM